MGRERGKEGGKEGDESKEAPPRRGVGEGDPRTSGSPAHPDGSHLGRSRRGAPLHSPAPLVPLSPDAQHSASSSQSAQRADVPMVPAGMVPPPLARSLRTTS